MFLKDIGESHHKSDRGRITSTDPYNFTVGAVLPFPPCLDYHR
jgi:hypothetical protein